IISNKNDVSELNNILFEEKILLIIKPHPEQNLKYFDDIFTEHIKVINNDDLLYNNVDLYALLSESDALLTDYSSVYIDYLLLNKPIGFTIDDINNYEKNLGFSVKDPLKY